MMLPQTPPRRIPRAFLLAPCLLAALLLFAAAEDGQGQQKMDVLRIGTSGSFSSEKSSEKEKSSLETLREFIKEETTLNNQIVDEKDWRTLADKMAKGQLHLGAFQGYEFAWAQEKYPQLKPLALTVNAYTYPVGFVVTQKTNPAKDLAGLKGKTFAIPTSGQRFLRLFLEKQAGAKPEAFFSKVTTPENIEDALDDVVDGDVTAMVVDLAALKTFERRKPARYKKLKEVAKSQPFPPPLVAYYGTVLDGSTREQFRNGLLNARRKEKGKQMLTLFRLTDFAVPPPDLPKVLAETRKTYPPGGQAK
jgi:ABC-type phosphate/phosphonate transport system substrate-binding protein